MSSPSSGRSHQLTLAKLERDTYVRVYFVRDGAAGAVLGMLKGLTRTDARIADASGEIVEIPFASITQVSAPELEAPTAGSASGMPGMPAVLSMLAFVVLLLALATMVYGTKRLSVGDLVVRVVGIGAPIGYLVGAWFSARVDEERASMVLEFSVASATLAAGLAMFAARRLPALHSTVSTPAVVLVAGVLAAIAAGSITPRAAT